MIDLRFGVVGFGVWFGAGRVTSASSTVVAQVVGQRGHG